MQDSWARSSQPSTQTNHWAQVSKEQAKVITPQGWPAGAAQQSWASGCVQEAGNCDHSSGVAGRSSAAELGERLYAGLVRLLLGEAYEATSTYLMSTIPLPVNKRDTGMGAPRVTGATWPEAARRYLSAAATAAYLSMAPGRPPSLVTQPLAGALSCLGVHDWLAYLTAGLNAVPSSFQAIEEAGRAEVAARGGLRMPALPSPAAGHEHAAHAVKQEHADSPALAAGSSAMDVDGAPSTAAAAAAAAGGVGAQQGAVQAGAGCAPACAVPGLLAAAEAAGLPSQAPGALAGLAADEGVVSGPFLGSSISSGGVHGPGALVSRVALLPAPQHGSRTAAEALFNLEDGRAMAAAERLLQHHRLSTRAFPTATQAHAQPDTAHALPQATHTSRPLPTAPPAHSEASQSTAIGPSSAGGHPPPAPAAVPLAASAPTESHTLPGASGPSEAAATGASPAAAPTAAASAGTKIKFKLKGKLGSNGAPGASPAPAAQPPAAAPAAAGAGAGAHGHTHAAPRFALHNEDPPYEACLSAEER
ncbi:hypothetical protein DUNSADRAFT_16437 [Dunaliella salina]|uniref:Uncharacterized protein n=1 Tax=Dunaliella salina TaxID=3046 RepID=A0ABQ7G3M6_DUNSA|nr:hypothetical protein DUNSADRAFT_16437 [Dunaliella salina]|eukprot:KAF5829172.1 hypothetical protein DUNSADRAFT_16437 [Dunaliella salina]